MSDIKLEIRKAQPITLNMKAAGPVGPTGPAAAWGNIPGDIEDQTDLYTILNEKADKSFAIAMAVVL